MMFIVGLLAGAVGGNVVAGLFRAVEQGVLVNTLAGLAGGAVANAALSLVSFGRQFGALDEDLGELVAHVAFGGVGGAVLLALVRLVRSMGAK